MKNWSLVSQFRITLIWIILSTILASFVTYILVAVIFMYGISSEKIYPANYYESQIPLVEDYVRSHSDKGIGSLQQEDVSELITGDTIYYQFTDKNGKKLYGTYSSDIFDSKETMYQKINSTFIKDKYYIHTIPIITDIGNIDGAVSIIYSLDMSTINNANPWMPVDLVFIICSPFLYMVLFTLIFSSHFAKSVLYPLQILTKGTEQIKNSNLDFELDYHANNELGALCESFSAMQNALKNSLSAQWKMEQERTENVQALAHDLKSPLSIIKAYTETLIDDTEIDVEQTEYLSVIKENTEKSIVLVNQMQYTTELTLPNVNIEKDSINLEEWLQKKRAEYELRAKDKKVCISLKMASDIPATIFADKNKLERILDNVISNSIEYVPVSGRIEINVEADETYIYYAVLDNGDGFSSKDLNKALERFYRGDEARSSKGSHSGLGLYIVKQLSGLLGGSVEISNPQSGGACVKFWHTY